MIADELQKWGKVLANMREDAALLTSACEANEWFTVSAVQHALSAMLPWFSGNQLQALRYRYPATTNARNIGLILAGNLPLVGLHDVLMVLLSGHHAVVKPSHKDTVLLRFLLDHSAESVRSRVTFAEAIAPKQIDFLIATGSNATAIQIESAFVEVPHLIRRSRFSVAFLDGEEDRQALEGLSNDILLYHGMGCRSVACLLVPSEMDLGPLFQILNQHCPHAFSESWSDVVRYERARMLMGGRAVLPCSKLVAATSNVVQSAGIGVLNVVRYQDAAQAAYLLSATQDQIQCVVGRDGTVFGQSQFPKLDDFADGVDTLRELTRLY
jgi:hypothetical protein